MTSWSDFPAIVSKLLFNFCFLDGKSDFGNKTLAFPFLEHALTFFFLWR